jgi:DNA repair ATPase RecN
VINKQEIDLLIRASVQNKQDLQSIPKTIKALEDALDRQAAAAKRGESSIDELKATLLSLQQTQSALTSNAGLVGAFQKLGETVQRTEERVARTAKTYEDYRKRLDGLNDVTEKQQERLIKLSQASERANSTLSKQRLSYTEMAAALKTAGIETNNLADAELKIRDAAAQLGVVMNKNQAAITNYGDAVRKARDEEKKRAADAAANAQAQVAAQRAIEAQQQRLLAASNKAAIAAAAAKDAFAQDNALITQADNAERAARSYTSLARAAKDLSPATITLREAVNQLINPVNKATQSIDGLEKSLMDTGKSIGSIKGPVREYNQSLKALSDAQKAIGAQSQLVQDFQQQAAALRAARTEFTQARAQVQQYADAVRQGGDSGQRFAKALADAQVRARATAEALNAQVQATRNSREALERAGISTRALADAEQRLVQAARTSVSQLNALKQAVTEYGVASEKAGKQSLGAGDGERTTLNFAQRLRGQILSLTASYVGLFGAIQQAKGAIDSMVGLQTINQRIAVGLDTTDPRKVGQEFDYLRSRADFYGVGLRALADSYGSFAIASRSANQDAKTTRFEFEQLTAGFRVMKLTTDQQSRAFAQVNQILSKTKPELEDIKTIAEAGFPAQSIMAKGLREIGVAGIRAGTEVQDMAKLMKDGLLSSQDAVLGLAVGIQKTMGNQVPAAVKTLQAELGRFETAWFDFQNKVAESGFGEAFQRALVNVREFLNSEDGSKAAESIGKAFEAITNGAILLLKNIETVKTLSEAFIALWVTARFSEAVTGLANLKNGVDGVGKEITKTQKIFKAFDALIIGWTIGTVIRQKFAIVREAGEWMADGLEATWAVISNSFLAMVNVLPIYFTNALKRMVNNMGGPLTAIAKGFSNIAGAIGLDGTKTALDKAVQTVTFEYEDTKDVVAKARAQLDKDLAAIKSNRAFLSTKREGVVLAAGATDITPTGRPARSGTRLEDDKKAEAAAKKRLADIESITKSLESLTVRSDKAQSDSLEAQLKAVDVQYEALSRRIKALGGKEGAEFAKAFADGISSLKGQITDNFNKKLADEQASLTKKLEDAEAAAGRRSKDSLDARLKAVTDKYAQTYREIDELRRKLIDNGQDAGVADQMKTRLDLGVQEIQNLEKTKFIEDQLRDKAQEVNNLVQARNATIQANKELEEAGLINNAELRDRIRNTVEQTQPAIQALTASGIAFAQSLDSAFDPAKVQQFIAKMQLAVATGQSLNKEFEITQKQLSDAIANNGAKAFNTMADAIGQAVNKQMSWSDALKATGRAALQFFADMLKWYAEAIIKQQILNSLQTGSSGGSFLKFFGALFGVGVNHEGGVVGDVNNRTRNVSPLWFANAPRYHTGGLAGIAPNEFPAILKRNEEVLTEGDPRNVLNGGLNPSGGGGAGSPTSVVLVDSRERVPQAMAGSAGGKVVVQQIKDNLPTIRAMLKGGN